MNKHILTALEGSICKWDLVCSGIGQDRGWVNCPLCQYFDSDGCTSDNGENCPAMLDVEGCVGTPYEKWDNLTDNLDSGILDVPIENRQDAIKLAEEELVHLLSQLPEGHPWRDQI